MIYLIYILLNYHTYWELNNWTPFKPVNVMSLPLTWYASSTHSGIIRQMVCKELMFFLEAHGKHFLWANHILPLLPLPDFQPVLTHSLDVWGFLPALDLISCFFQCNLHTTTCPGSSVIGSNIDNLFLITAQRSDSALANTGWPGSGSPLPKFV